MAENIIQFYWPSSLQDTAETEISSTPKLDGTDKLVCSDSPLPSFDKSVFSGSPLPSFDTFCRGRNDTNLSSDQSTTGSETSFSIESLIRAATAAPRSSTPEIQHLSVVSQSEIGGMGQTDETSTELQKVNKRHIDKPPYTYIAMCVMAIEMSPRKGLTQSEIREKLKTMFPFFNGSYTGWKESVRACVSRSKYFVRVSSLEEPRPFLWMVNHKTLTPGMFKKQVYRGAGEHYKDYLHDQLGVSPVCSVPHTTKPADDTVSVRNMELPDIQCFQQTITAETSESEDFLQAHRDIGCVTKDEKSQIALHSDSDSSKPSDNITGGKRKFGIDTTETVAKKSRKIRDSRAASSLCETRQAGYTPQDQAYTGYWNYNGQCQGNAYQSYYPQQYNQHRIQQNYQYYPYPWTTGSHYYRQPQMPHMLTPGQYNGMMTSHAAAARYQPAVFSGYAVAQHMLNRYRHWSSQNSKYSDYQYDYRWYTAPTADDNANGVDLSTTSSDKQ